MGVPQNSLPTAEKSGTFKGRETTLQICKCGCGQPTVRFADDSEVCVVQTALARIRAVDDPEGVFDKLVAEMPPELRNEAEEAGVTAEEATAIALYCDSQPIITVMVVSVSRSGDDDSK